MVAASALLVTAITSALLIADLEEAPAPRGRTALVLVMETSQANDAASRRAEALTRAADRAGVVVMRVVRKKGDARTDAFELDATLRARLEDAGVGRVAVSVLITDPGEETFATSTDRARRLGFEVIAVSELLKVDAPPPVPNASTPRPPAPAPQKSARGGGPSESLPAA